MSLTPFFFFAAQLGNSRYRTFSAFGTWSTGIGENATYPEAPLARYHKGCYYCSVCELKLTCRARMWGRLVGLAYIVPATLFWARGKIQPRHKPAVVGLGLLVGMQV